MKVKATLLVGLLGLLSLATHPARAREHKDECCGLVQTALTAYRNIKPGMTRRQVEAQFYLDGGAMTPAESRYIYRGCEFIRVNVSFKVKDESRLSDDDIVTRASKPYLDLPTVD